MGEREKGRKGGAEHGRKRGRMEEIKQKKSKGEKVR